MNKISRIFKPILIILCLITFLLENDLNAQKMKPKILYFYDPLCGWCYGFSPVIQELEKKYSDKYDFDIISGGMITGDRIGPIGEVASYIGSAYKRVETTTGVIFGKDFLDITLKNGTAIFTSVPSSLALVVFKSFNTNQNINYGSLLQKAIYFDGVDPSDFDKYAEIAGSLGVDKNEFKSRLNDPKYMQETENDFKYSSESGVEGFPTVILKAVDGTYHQLSNGYTSFNTIESNLKSILNN
jgi:putative protein-disulfide isomerase